MTAPRPRGEAPWFLLPVSGPCNNRCRLCAEEGTCGSGGLALTLAEAVAAAARRGAGAGTWLYGGEPTLRADLPDLLAALTTERPGPIGLTTNARVLAHSHAASTLRERGLTDARVALHGATAPAHDWQTREPGSYRQTARGIRHLAQAGVRVTVEVPLTRPNLGQAADVARLAAGLGAVEVVFRLPWPARERDPRGFLGQLPGWDGVAGALRGGLRALAHGASCRVGVRGTPLCLLDPADRLRGVAGGAALPAAPGPAGAGPATGDRGDPVAHAPAHAAVPPPCQACAARIPCPGPHPASVRVLGFGELRTVRDVSRGPARQARTPNAGSPELLAAGLVVVPVEAPCDRGCPRCGTREAYGETWPLEPPRSLRRRLVRAARSGASGVAFGGASPWSHPDLPFCIAAARRLGFRTIEVWGPLHPVAALDEAALRKLAALTRVRVPHRLPGDTPPGDPEAARQRLRLGAPGVEIAEYRPATADTGVPGAPPGRSTLFEAWGPLAVASACQPA